jgi:hypothetical protein
MVSPDFYAAVQDAISRAVAQADDATVYMLTGWGNESEVVPIYLLPDSLPAQREAGGCPHCTYLGLWTESWPGFPGGPHGVIFLFEKGLRGMRGSQTFDGLTNNVYEVLIHELGHALQRDHVLDAMEAAGQAGYSAAGYRGLRGQTGCGSCPSRSI